MSHITIQEFESLTPQEVFDRAATHIATTRQKSVKDLYYGSGGCTYAGSGCNAAIFIREEEREKADWIGSGRWESLYDNGSVPYSNLNLIIALQLAHDNAGSWGESFLEEYICNMNIVATKYNLSANALNLFKD